MAMRAAVLERDRRAVFQAVEDNGLAENRAAEGTPGDLAVIGGDVPVVSEEHRSLLRSTAAHSLDQAADVRERGDAHDHASTVRRWAEGGNARCALAGPYYTLRNAAP